MTPRSAYAYRSDPDVPAFDDSGPRTVMDAQCGLCARGARWIAHNDRHATFRIIPMQSDLGRALFRHFGLDPKDPATWLMLDAGKAYGGSTAILRTAWRLGGLWTLLTVGYALPRPLRDSAYGLIARNRTRLSRPVDLCALPDPAIQKRLLT